MSLCSEIKVKTSCWCAFTLFVLENVTRKVVVPEICSSGSKLYARFSNVHVEVCWQNHMRNNNCVIILSDQDKMLTFARCYVNFLL